MTEGVEKSKKKADGHGHLIRGSQNLNTILSRPPTSSFTRFPGRRFLGDPINKREVVLGAHLSGTAKAGRFKRGPEAAWQSELQYRGSSERVVPFQSSFLFQQGPGWSAAGGRSEVRGVCANQTG